MIRRLIWGTVDSIHTSARQREYENRKQLGIHIQRSGLLYETEKRLIYSGIAGKVPGLTAEIWLLANMAVSAAVYFMVRLLFDSFVGALLAMAVIQIGRYLYETIRINHNYRAVERNLMKFLNFLGNYSITAGEVTSVFNQISKYLEEPLRRVLDECYYEAQVSGDAGTALLAMAEKIEHPGFKELVRNIEISMRYSADFTALVQGSRRTIREQLRTSQERKSMVREALINMLLLVGMAVFILLAVESLIGLSVQQILWNSMPGRLCLGAIGFIFILLYFQVNRLERC